MLVSVSVQSQVKLSFVSFKSLIISLILEFGKTYSISGDLEGILLSNHMLFFQDLQVHPHTYSPNKEVDVRENLEHLKAHLLSA